MAEHMKTYLGSMLFADPVGEERITLPSPEELKHKILVKAKKLPPGKHQSEIAERPSGQFFKDVQARVRTYVAPRRQLS
jgi:hypothetical protein